MPTLRAPVIFSLSMLLSSAANAQEAYLYGALAAQIFASEDVPIVIFDGFGNVISGETELEYDPGFAAIVGLGYDRYRSRQSWLAVLSGCG